MAAAAAIALVQCVAFIIAARMCLRIAGPDGDGTGYRHALLGFVLCLASPMALSEAGTTIIDLLTAIPVLLAYHVLLTRQDTSASRHACLIAGCLLGGATGLKLTNATFAIGAPFFLLTGPTPSWRRVADLVRLTLGGFFGFLLVAGDWHFQLWQHFHNPLFPYYNNIFHSPDTSPWGWRDARFGGTSIWDLVRYPIYWLIGGSPTPGLLSPASETDPKDARFALVLLVLPVALMVLAIRRSSRRLLYRPETGLLFACAVDFAVWLYQFGIHRYMIPLEIMIGAVLLVLVGWIDTGRLRGWLLFALALVTVIRVHVAMWQRMPWADHWQSIAATPLHLPGAPIIFLGAKPSAFVALSLPDNARYVCASGDVDLDPTSDRPLIRRLKDELTAANDQALYALLDDKPPADTMPDLMAYGLRVGSVCHRVDLGDRHFRLCEIVRK